MQAPLTLTVKRTKEIQWDFFFGDIFIQGTPPFRGHEIWSQKNVHIIFVYAFLPACPLYPYYKENLWLNSGVIRRAMFARALKETRDNDVFGYNFGHARWPIY